MVQLGNIRYRLGGRADISSFLLILGGVMKSTKFFTFLTIFLAVACWQVSAQPDDGGAIFEEPNLPQCPQGYVWVADFGGFNTSGALRRDIEPKSRIHPFSLQCPANLAALGWSREGHPENSNCTLTGGTASECLQFQDFENYTIALNGIVFGMYADYV